MDSPPLLPIPHLDIRWVHAGALHLSLPLSPITTASHTYKAFSLSESERIEQRWNSLPTDQQNRFIQEWGQGEGEGASSAKQPKAKRPDTPDGTEVINSGEEQRDTRYKDLLIQASNPDLVKGVPVSQVRAYQAKLTQDSLFEVDLPTLSLHPVFWAHTGPRISVLRGTWFVTDDTKPCSWDLADEIEKAYQ